MSVETATYIDQLVAANPAGSDVVADGATHLRLVKSVLQNQFPNLGNTPVTVTALQLNAGVPIGSMLMWSQTIATIPAGWAMALGQTVARSDGAGNITLPDMRNVFAFGASVDSGGAAGTNVGNSGGSTTTTGTVGGHAVSVAEMPIHAHFISDPGHSHTINDPGHSHTVGSVPVLSALAAPGASGFTATGYGTVGTSSNTTGITGDNSSFTGITITNNTGSGATHTHSLTMNATPPPFKSFAWIVKV